MEVETPALKKLDDLKVPKKKENYIRKAIRETVKLNPHGVTLPQLIEALPYDKRTIEKHLYALTFTGDLCTEKIGVTTLYLSNLTDIKKKSENSIKLGDNKYEALIIKNRNGEYLLLRKSIENDTIGGFLIPTRDVDRFLEFVERSKSKFEEGL